MQGKPASPMRSGCCLSVFRVRCWCCSGMNTETICGLFWNDLAYMLRISILWHFSGVLCRYRSNVPHRAIPVLKRLLDALKRKRAFLVLFRRNDFRHNNSRRTFYFAFCGVLCGLSVLVYYAGIYHALWACYAVRCARTK